MTYPLRRNVAGVATLEPDEPVLTSALEIVGRTGATLHLVHAFELPSIAWEPYGRLGYLEGPSPESLATTLRAEFERRVSARAPGVAVEYHILAGGGASAILDTAETERADMVIVGATRRGAIGRALLGTTAQRVMRHATAPLLVLRQPFRHPLARVLFTTDLEPFSIEVHETGIAVVAAIGGSPDPEMRTLFTVGPLRYLPPSFTEERVEEFAKERVVEFAAKLRSEAGGLEGIVRTGDPSTEIVAYAAEWDADLVVMGNHGRRSRDRWLAGSVAEATLRDVHSNVLVIPASPGE